MTNFTICLSISIIVENITNKKTGFFKSNYFNLYENTCENTYIKIQNEKSIYTSRQNNGVGKKTSPVLFHISTGVNKFVYFDKNE